MTNSKNLEQMIECLNDLDDRELISLFRDVNSYDGSFEFCDGWDMEEFISCMLDGKRGSQLRDFITDVVDAVNNYDGSDGIEYAQWGYFDGYTLEIKDEGDIAEEAREDYLEDLAEDLIDNGLTRKYSSLPEEVVELLNLFESYEFYGWEGEGTYKIERENGEEIECRHFDEDDFESFFEWIDELVDDKGALVNRIK